MALARLSVKVGKKGKASAHAKYIARDGKYAKDEKFEKLEFTGHGNMPSWAEKDPNIFWQTADEFERKNGTAYREHIISLPRELTPEQRHEFLKDWIAQEIGDKHVYQYAIHNPKALDGKEQPHAHLMFSERMLDNIERAPDQFFKRYNPKKPELGGAKKANTGLKPAQRRAELKEQRQRLEDLYNEHLKKAGLDIRVSMKSFADRNLSLEPINFSMVEIKKGSERVDAYKKRLEIKSEISDLKQDAKVGLVAVVNEYKELKAKAEEARIKQAQAETQAQAERQRAIAKTTPFELLKINVKTKVHDHYNSKNLSGEMKLGSAFGQVLQARKDGYRVQLGQGDNTHLENNKTAQNIKDFMYKHITNIDIIVDYGELSIEQFTKKYSIECDLKDLEQLYQPKQQPQQEHAPSPKVKEQREEINNDLDLDI